MTSRNLIFAALIWASACACHPESQSHTTGQTQTAPPAQQTSTASEGKPQAPVQIDAQLASGSAQLTVRFAQPATDVEVRAEGVRGLTVQRDPVLATAATVSAGQTLTFDVPFTAGPGESMLAVNVRGAFPGGVRSAVRAFPVGTSATGQQNKEQTGTTTVNGTPVQLLPAQTK